MNERGTQAARRLKERALRREGPDADLTTTLALWHDGVLLGVMGLGDYGGGALHRRILLALSMSDADVVQLVCDAFWQAEPDHRKGEGTLAERAGRGDPTVRETLLVMTWREVDDPNRPVVAVLPYERDGRSIVWGETPGHDDDRDEGALVEAVRGGFVSRSHRPTPALPIEAIAASLGVALVMDVLTPPARNEPCPCGSGNKAKHCCWAVTA